LSFVLASSSVLGETFATSPALLAALRCSLASKKSRGGYMSDRALIIAALIIGGAIVAASFQTRVRYALSSASSNVAWRMDTWSGQIDICAAAYLPEGPLVRCGALVVGTPGLPGPGAPGQPAPTQPAPQQQPQSLDTQPRTL
jgi:hypothetical protein